MVWTALSFLFWVVIWMAVAHFVAALAWIGWHVMAALVSKLDSTFHRG